MTVKSAGDPATSMTLLARVGQSEHDPEAWNEFVDRYGRMVLQWCRRWGLQEADARDVTQDVLLALARQMRDFRYDASGSFRGWVKTVAYRAWCKVADTRRRPANAAAGTADALDGVPARDDLLDHIERAGERELLELAIARVRPRVKETTWEAFRLQAFEGLSGTEAAARLNMRVGAVYMAKSNVQRMLQEEVQALDGTGAGPVTPHGGEGTG